MPSIKTREALRTIKTFDRAKTLGQKIKGGAEEAKEYADELQNKAYQSENEYAGNAVQSTEERVARNSVLMMGTLEQIVIYPNHLLKEDNETAPLRLYNDSSFELIVSEHYYIKRDCEYRISIDFQLTPVEETYKAYLFFST